MFSQKLLNYRNSPDLSSQMGDFLRWEMSQPDIYIWISEDIQIGG